MKKEDIPKIFDKFSQIESSLNRNKGGVGLGLSITKQLIDSHLGAIWVESEEKKGSTFSVVLPLRDEKKIFKMNLLRDITNCDNIGIIRILYKDDSLIEKLKDKKLIAQSNSIKELYCTKDDYKEYYYYIPKLSYDSFSVLYNNLESYCAQIKNDENEIILSKAHSAKDGDKIKDIILN